MSSVLRSAFVHKGLPRGLPGPVMDGSGRPFLCSLPSFQTNEIPFITSYSHKSGLSQLHWSCSSSTNSIHFQRIFWLRLRAAAPTHPHPALSSPHSDFFIIFCASKGENPVCPKSGKAAVLCLPPRIPVSSSIPAPSWLGETLPTAGTRGGLALPAN